MPFMRLQHLQILEYTGWGGLGINPLKYEERLAFKVAFVYIISYLMSLSSFVMAFQESGSLLFPCHLCAILFGVLTSITVEADSINTKQTGKSQQTFENICQDYPI